MNIINLTGDPIRVVSYAMIGVTFQPSVDVARILTENVRAGHIAWIPLFRQRSSPVVGLPDPTDGTVYIVTPAVRMAVPDRMDVFSPGNVAEDYAGNPIGCLGLVGNGDPDE